MAEFAMPVPSDVIGELLGVPEEDRSWFPERSRAVAAILEAGQDIWRHLSAADRAARELRDRFAELVAKRRAEPRDDLISAVVELQRADPEKITEEELLANLVGVYNGGFMTTTHMFGNGLVLLLDRPDAREAVLADREVAAAYVDEIIRYVPPVHFGVRWTTAPAEIMGVPVPAFGEVLVLLAAANRDPHRYPHPDVFDHTRPQAQSMSFSVGPHYCLGAALARLEGVLAFRMLLRRFPELAVAEPPRPADQLMFRGYESLMVTVGG
jgi:cytochrome P450